MSDYGIQTKAESIAKRANYCLKTNESLSIKLKSVGSKTPQPPSGGQLKEDYVFQWLMMGK